ncbi:MAG: hypothetical protein RLZZ502_1108 [Pseudomonadota bacterium]
MQGFGVALAPMNLLWGIIGVTLGTAIGVLPGLGPALTVAMLLPLTAKLDPTGAMIMFAGIYYGAMYGGSTTSILLNTPGETASIMTSLEGNQMAKRGRAGPALATAAWGSFIAGSIATVLLSLFAPYVADVALKFGPAEYFALIVMAFMTVSAMMGESTLRGIAALFVGLTIGLIGMDNISGQSRLAFGVPELLDGIDVVVVAVALFAIGETLFVATYLNSGKDEVIALKGSAKMTPEDWKRSWPAWLRGTAIGFPFGSIPAGGTEIPTFLSYATEKKLSKNPEEFGKGAIEGVAGPEAANNATVTGALVPLLTLGLPVSATAAIILVAFQQYGISPGPLLFQNQGPLVWGLIASLYIGNVLLLVLNLPLVGFWIKFLTIPKPQLYGGIMLFAVMGAYGLHQSALDIIILLTVGLLGFGMRLYDFPLAPVVIGVVLGPMAEKNLRNALAIAQGDLWNVVSKPIPAVILLLTLAAVLGPAVYRRLRSS